MVVITKSVSIDGSQYPGCINDLGDMLRFYIRVSPRLHGDVNTRRNQFDAGLFFLPPGAEVLSPLRLAASQ